ncbi:MAG TPA: CopD family protein, partial [Candidatus Methylomirabilis sp.]|nr:CopD family protein [Candidatus Methylomirabilis sp.]
MRPLLLAVLWVHLGSGALLTGAFFMIFLAGRPATAGARRWEEAIVAWSRLLVLVALASGVAWLMVRTAVFENRPGAALDVRAVWRAALDTWPGLVWLARHGLLLVLAAFLAMRVDAAERWNWIAARGEALLLAGLALALEAGSSHAAAIVPGVVSAVASDAIHLLGTGLWLGALVPLALLLHRAGRAERDDGLLFYAVRAARRFSRAALIAMLALIGSGVLNALAQVESVAGLLGTTHGRLLLAKLAVLVPILAVATVNRALLLPVPTCPPPAVLGPPENAAANSPDRTALGPREDTAKSTMRRLAAFVGLEAGLALVLLALAAAMTLTTPARHGDPIWPLPFRLSLDALGDLPAGRWRAFLGGQLGLAALAALVASLLWRRRRAPVLAGSLALLAIGAGVGLPPLVVDAYPTAYRRPLVTYDAASIAEGMSTYQQHCASCHGAGGTTGRPGADLLGASASRRRAGELYWLLTHGAPARGMPEFGSRLAEARRWDVINFIRALGAAGEAARIGPEVEPGRAWLVAPDFTIAVGPLAPWALRDYRGQRMVLLVLYTLPGSRARMAELARSYDFLSATGVEIIAVPTHGAREAIAELGQAPPVLFPVVTDGTADIVAAYHLFAPGAHAEMLIDRQGYI